VEWGCTRSVPSWSIPTRRGWRRGRLRREGGTQSSPSNPPRYRARENSPRSLPHGPASATARTGLANRRSCATAPQRSLTGAPVAILRRGDIAGAATAGVEVARRSVCCVCVCVCVFYSFIYLFLVFDFPPLCFRSCWLTFPFLLPFPLASFSQMCAASRPAPGSLPPSSVPPSSVPPAAAAVAPPSGHRAKAASLQREELLRVKKELMDERGERGEEVEIDPSSSASSSASAAPSSNSSSPHSSSPTPEEIAKCAWVKTRSLDASGGSDDPYTTLNVTESSTTAEIRRSYRRLTLLLHPDKHSAALCGEEAHAAFGFLVAAHDILADPDKRAAFDLYGDADQEAFRTQWEYDQYSTKKTKNFYTGSSHITNIDGKIWERLCRKPKGGRREEEKGRPKIWLIEL